MPQSLQTFCFLCLLLTLTPGADTALVLRSAIAGGRRAFVPTTIGICSGLLVHALLSSLGLSVVLQKSAALYSIVKMLGAAYLVYLGLRSLLDAWRPKTVDAIIVKGSGGPWSNFRIGLITNVLNPKCAVFYLTFLPQFVDVGRQVLIQSILLACIHVFMVFVWSLLIGSCVSYFAKQLAKPSVRRAFDVATGIALLGFGLRLAMSQG